MKSVYLIIISVVLFVAPATAQGDIHGVDFKNFAYQPYCAGDEVQRFTVKDGEYSKETPMDGYTDRVWFKVFEVSYGDLNADGRDDAVVLTTCNTGGTGNFTEGFIYSMKGGKPSLVSRIPGGDRAYGGLRTARVENGALVVESNDVGEMGGACCPEFKVTNRYKLTGAKLVEQGPESRVALYPALRVAFSRGASGATLRVHVDAQDLKRFIVGARAGQTLDVSLNSDKASVRLIEEADVTGGVNNLRARLPKNGDYTIEVQNLDEKPIDVTLNIKIN
jgi:hypothetical protein